MAGPYNYDARTRWGKKDYWGLSSEFDPDWVLTDEQKKLRADLIELCRVKIRPLAVECDKNYTFPRESLEAMGDLGLLGLIIPKEFGGLGQNHVGTAMVCETLARYGCAALTMVYIMHIDAVSSVLFRYHNNPHHQKLLRRICKEKLVGTVAASDPSTGGHFWYHLSSKSKILENGDFKVLKYVSWATSAGFADFYLSEGASPENDGNYSNITAFVVYNDEVRANSSEWSALGLHANQSGEMVIDEVLPPERIIGSIGEGIQMNNEVLIMYFLLSTSACWNGLSMGCMDLAKKHVTRKAHADEGLRICDYPSIQDYFGSHIAATAVSRSHTYLVAQELDRATNNSDWTIHQDPKASPRAAYGSHLMMARLYATENVSRVANAMLQVCGGTGYKTELGIERLLRDSKAGALMAPSAEVLKQLLGKICLLGHEVIDMWQQKCDERVLHHELNKMTLDQKKSLLEELKENIKAEDGGGSSKHPFQDTDFDNPFNTAPPLSLQSVVEDKILHKSALEKEDWTAFTFDSRQTFGEKLSTVTFLYDDKESHSGCHVGQYIQMRVNYEDREHIRFLSPISVPTDFGRIQFLMKFETQGYVSHAFRDLKKGDKVYFRGPCGGYEYHSNAVDELTLLASGTGVAPALQIIRHSMQESADKTKLKLLYYADNMESLVFSEELNKYQANCPRLKVFYTVGEAPENWDGDEGFIDTEMLDNYVSKPDGIKHKIVICGGPTMSVACLHSLKKLGFPSDMMYVYGHFGTAQVRSVFGRYAKLSAHHG